MELDLSRTGISDGDLHHLKPLIRLQTLSLDEQRFSDAISDAGALCYLMPEPGNPQSCDC